MNTDLLFIRIWTFKAQSLPQSALVEMFNIHQGIGTL